MHKLIAVFILLAIVITLQAQAFSATLDCKFKDTKVSGIKSIQVSNESLFINGDLEIPLEKTKVNCGNFGRQTRLDGSALGYQVILKTCTTDALMEGSLIDSVQQISADLICNHR